MLIGVPKEIKTEEHRVGMTPSSVNELTRLGNDVLVQTGAAHRIGIDDLDQYDDMARFVDIMSEAGCDRFSVHARKAWLQGLSPRENRTVPPLRYEDVHRLKAEHPQLVIEINGGFQDLDVATAQLAHVDAVMIGRTAYEDPYAFARAGHHDKAAPHLQALFPKSMQFELLLEFVQTYSSPKEAPVFFDRYAREPLDKRHQKIRDHLQGLAQP